MRPEGPDEGRLRYVRDPKPPRRWDLEGILARVMGVVLALGVCVFLLLLFFYVILPLIVILLLWSLLRGLFRK
jgi:hypothetical protein